MFQALIIEDSIVQSKVIARMVAACEWSSVIANSLEDGILALSKDNYHLILCDLVLQNNYGDQVINEIINHSNGTIIAAMSATDKVNKSGSMLAKAKIAGAQFLLPKPFSLPKLSSLLQETQFRIENGQRHEHILVIDDSKSICSICESILKQLDFRVTTALSMDDALASVDLFDVDLILSDLNMPGIEPKNAIPYVRERFPQVGIIAMSGNIDKELESMLYNGADAIIGKPFDIPQMVEAVDNVLTNHANPESLEVH